MVSSYAFLFDCTAAVRAESIEASTQSLIQESLKNYGTERSLFLNFHRYSFRLSSVGTTQNIALFSGIRLRMHIYVYIHLDKS